MEDLIIKALSEVAFPVFLTVYLLTKGAKALENLATSIDNLRKCIGELESRVERLERIFYKLEERIDRK